MGDLIDLDSERVKRKKTVRAMSKLDTLLEQSEPDFDELQKAIIEASILSEEMDWEYRKDWEGKASDYPEDWRYLITMEQE